jgi:pantoate--beta-alanine ligase
MKIYKTIAEMQAACREVRASGKRLGLVPTMGALHAGHLSLVRAARASCEVVAATIFVNPLQFGPNEDLAKYPRTWEKDVAALEAERVDLLFAPSPEEMYPAGAATYVIVEGLSEKLDGKSRPGHFRGVTTVVAKLFEIVRPEVAYFGQKDAAQVSVLRKMVQDLNMDVRMQICPIVRESDGLALSSRNAYLDPKQRKQALVLHRALMRIQFEVDRGERSAAKLVEVGKSIVSEEPEVRLDFLEIVDPVTLDPVPDISKGALVAIAAYVGTTRLIDNIVVGASR